MDKGLVCFLIAKLLIGAVVGAVILRAAVSFFNKMSGKNESFDPVPEPEFPKAIGIAFLVALVNSIVSFVVGVGAGGSPLVAQVVSIPIAFLVMSGILSATLPTSTFGEALLVSLCYHLVVIAIVVIIVLIIGVVGGLAMG